MEKTYHILNVLDYKGGELGTRLNLTYDEFINELGEVLDFYDFIDSNEDFRNGENEFNYATENAYLKAGLDSGNLIEWIENERSIYGGGNNCWFIYECENNILLEKQLSHRMLVQAVDAYINKSE
jgi:hypothetical protein